MNNTKAWNVLGRILFILVFAASVAVFYLTKTGSDMIDFAINMVFDLIALIFLVVYFSGCARPLAKVVSSLTRVTDEIYSSTEDSKALWNRYSNEEIFGNGRLDERYSAYVREMRRLQKQNSLTANCSIADYIDEELIYSTVNKSFCDQVGGIMSGLGILFTFIGLVYGLRNFDASSVDLMQTSTQALMAGIKIAFLTSIFGLIYSLLFNIFYKKLLKNSLDALYDFQNAYTECVRPSNDHGAENAMLRLQMEQNAALESFGTSIGDQVSEAIITLMQPTVDQLQSTITQYVTVAIEDQRAGMEKVVRYFLDSMNSSLGNIFVQLKNRTEELARWEKDMIDGIRTMTEGVGRTSQDMAEAQASTQKIIAAMASYTDTIEKLTGAQNNIVGDMEAFMTDYRAMHEKEVAYVESLAAASQAAASQAQNSLLAADAAAAQAEKFQSGNAAAAQEIVSAGHTITAAAESVRVMSEAVTSDVNAAAARLERAAADMEGGLSRTVSDSLSAMDESLAKLTASMNNISSASGSVTQAMKSLPKSAASVDSDFKATAKVIDTELKLLLKAVSDTEKLLTRFNEDLARRIDG